MYTQGTEIIKQVVSAAFNAAYVAPENPISKYAYRLQTNEGTNVISWLGSAPQMREWKGDAIRKSVPEFTWNITNKQFESTVNFSYNVWNSSNGATQAKIQGTTLGRKAIAKPHSMVIDLLNSGATYTCYNGLSFFNASHTDAGSIYTTTQANSATVSSLSSTTAPTGYDMLVCIRKLHELFLSMKDNAGDPVFPNGYNDYRLMVLASTSYGNQLRQVANNESVLNSSSAVIPNELVGTFDFVTSPLFTAVSTTPAIYGFAVNTAAYPIIFQEHTPVQLVDNADTVVLGNSPTYFIRAFGSFNVAYGDWRIASKVTLST